jgi:hypothetical protein
MAESTAERDAQATLAEMVEWLEMAIKFNQGEVVRHDANLGKVGSLGVSIYDPVGRSLSYGRWMAFEQVLERIQKAQAA